MSSRKIPACSLFHTITHGFVFLCFIEVIITSLKIFQRSVYPYSSRLLHWNWEQWSDLIGYMLNRFALNLFTTRRERCVISLENWGGGSCARNCYDSMQLLSTVYWDMEGNKNVPNYIRQTDGRTDGRTVGAGHDNTRRVEWTKVTNKRHASTITKTYQYYSKSIILGVKIIC